MSEVKSAKCNSFTLFSCFQCLCIVILFVIASLQFLQIERIKAELDYLRTGVSNDRVNNLQSTSICTNGDC